MNGINTTVTLDLSCQRPRAKVYAKQGDGGTRVVVARFVNGSTALTADDLDGVDHVEFNVLRPDGYVVKSEADFLMTGDRTTGLTDYGISGTLTAEMLEKAGRGFGDFLLVDGGGNVLSAARFVIEIGEAADSERSIPPPEPEYLLMVFDAIAVADYLAGNVYTATEVTDTE